MPTSKTSKDILKDAADAYKSGQLSEMAITDEFELVLKDCQAARAKNQIASTGLGVLKKSQKTYTDRLDDLEKAMQELKKNEAVMAAPADQKAFQGLMKDFGSNITACTKAMNRAASAIKECEGLLK